MALIEIRDSTGTLQARGDTIESCVRQLVDGLERYHNVVVDLQKQKAVLGASVPIEDFLELYDAAHAVIDKIRMHVDHAEYEGGMNAVLTFRAVAAELSFKHDDKVPDPLGEPE